MSTASMQVHGLEHALGKISPRLASGPISRFMRSSGFVVQARAQVNTRPNVFDGSVLNAFIVEVDSALIPRWTVIANTSEHAIYLELGTRPHFPPIDAIAPWADAHGIEPYVLARHISIFGTKAHPYLVPALEQSRGAINGLLSIAAAEIEAQAGQ